jgi:glutamate-1-semialdehyde 2,1-aminomutase
MATKSEELYEEACRFLPGGVSRNAVFRKPHPIYVRSASGCRVTDVEGRTCVDFANNMTSLIHGHAHPDIIEAVGKQLPFGTAYNLGSEIEVAFARHMCGRNGGFEKIRFVNSGTEAVTGLIRAARAFTGRPKIAKVEGAYHGAYDFAEVSQTSGPGTWGDPDGPASVPVAYGTPRSVLDEVVILPHNDPVRALRILDRHKAEIACVLIDPMPHRVGLIPATGAFVGALHRWTRADGALLGFDEVITFRGGYGGAQDGYDVRPDLTALGKIIGGGFPIGAIAGRTDVMKVMDPREDPLLLPHSGTFSANPVSMTAGLAAMTLFTCDEIARINGLAERARTQIGQAIRTAGIPASVTGAGSMFRVHLKPAPPADYRSSYADKKSSRILAKLLGRLLERGFLLINSGTGAISTAMGPAEIDGLSEAMLSGFEAIKPDLDGTA